MGEDEFDKFFDSITPAGSYDAHDPTHRALRYTQEIAWRAGREAGMREAAKIADPGKMPCDCVKQSPYPNGPFHSCDCFCGNSGDIRDTASWCALKNACTAILSAIREGK